jgi:hypothetical protein
MKKQLKHYLKLFVAVLIVFVGAMATAHYLMNSISFSDSKVNIDDIEFYELDENITIGNYIEQQINCINTTKKLIRTNELNNIQNKIEIDLTMDFIKHIINKDKIMDNEFIKDELFNGILK